MGWTRETVLKVAKRTGLPVVEAWSSRDAGVMGTVRGPMLHHTGSSKTAAGDYPTLKIVRDGRSDLLNSLCMYGLGRSGTIYCISEKLSWHAGAGSWNGVTDGNGHFAGIEAESDGSTSSWSAIQLDAYARLVASILLEAGADTTWMPRHADYALPKGRKVDTSGLDYAALKAKVNVYLKNGFNELKFPVVGAISGCFNLLGKLDEFGQPVGPEVPTADGVGRWQEFEKGAIYWHPEVDKGNAHQVKGEIRKLWLAMAPIPESLAGYPLTDEITTPSGVGRFNHFSAGWSIYWSPTTGAQPIHGGIKDTWAAQGWEAGKLGFPTDAEHATDEGIVQNFQGGSILWANAKGTVRLTKSS